MEAILLLVSTIGFVGVVVWGMQHAERRRIRLFGQWEGTAAELGLSVLRPGENDRTLQGVLDGVPVRADLKYEKQGKTYAHRCTLYAGRDGRIPESLVVRADSFTRSMSRLLDGQDEQLGDPEFDAQVELPALDVYACAALSFGARERLSHWIEAGGEVRQGMLVFDALWTEGHDRLWLVRMLRSLAQLGRSLSVTPDSLHQRLAQNAVQDPSPGVRKRNLHFLADAATRAPAELLSATGRALLGDVHPPVRLIAAQLVGAEGHSVLTALAANPELQMSVRSVAANALGRGPVPALDALRALLVPASPPELACAALSAVGEYRLRPLSSAAAACSSSEHESVRAAAASALGALADAQAEPVLLGLLSDASAEVQRASAEALGACGSVAAVEPLLLLTEGFGRSELRRAARGAIGRIQSRLGNVEAGRVSLADDRELAGALDLAEPSALRVGDLSLAEPAESEPGSTTQGMRAPAAAGKPR